MAVCVIETFFEFLEVVDAEVEVLYGEGVDVRLQGAQQGGEVKEGGLNIF